MERRDFLRSGLRGLIIAGLAAISGVFVYRNYTTKETCEFTTPCQDCKQLKSCKKPEGLKFKRDQKVSNN
ncbi:MULTISPECIES: hypothetical protein [Marinifilum]|uniref:hypothetical protein n=1 Tax=Marinifilum TaxID=866673 RepID=UPI0027C806F4|nr:MULTISPECIES: hypothetical protein [Marinifilum]MDQ2178032.1 hypothetical protein [Marinifilum sp. D714]